MRRTLAISLPQGACTWTLFNFLCYVDKHMVIRRLLISLLLCLVIPVQGFASMGVSANACPMQNTTSGAAAEACPMQHCCNDAETYGKTGKICKTGQECQSSFQFPHTFSVQVTPITMQSISIAHVALFVPTIDPSGIWRPPASF